MCYFIIWNLSLHVVDVAKYGIRRSQIGDKTTLLHYTVVCCIRECMSVDIPCSVVQ
jgi:hypothetical protein